MTFGIGIDFGLLRAWKEVVIGILFFSVFVVFLQIKNTKKSFTLPSGLLLIGTLLFIGIIGTLTIHLLLIDASLIRRAMAMRYDYL
jgi:hypothetical protein